MLNSLASFALWRANLEDYTWAFIIMTSSSPLQGGTTKGLKEAFGTFPWNISAFTWAEEFERLVFGTEVGGAGVRRITTSLSSTMVVGSLYCGIGALADAEGPSKEGPGRGLFMTAFFKGPPYVEGLFRVAFRISSTGTFILPKLNKRLNKLKIKKKRSVQGKPTKGVCQAQLNNLEVMLKE